MVKPRDDRFHATIAVDLLTLGIPEVYGYRYETGSFSSVNGSVTYLGKEAFSLPIVLPTLGVKVVY